MATLSFDQFLQKAGGTTNDVQVVDPNQPLPSPSQATTSIPNPAIQTPQIPPVPPSSGVKPLADALSGIAQDYKNAIPNFINEAGRNDASTSKNPIIRTAENAAGATGSALGTVFSPVSRLLNAGITTVVNPDNPMVQKFASLPWVSKTLDFIDSAGKDHPEAARNASNGLSLALSAMGEGPVNDGISKIGDVAKTGVSDAASTVKDNLNKAKDSIIPKPKDIATKINDVANEWEKPTEINKPTYNKTRQILDKTPEIPKFLAEQRLNPFTHIEDGKYTTTDSADALRETAGKMSNETLRPSLQMADYTTPKTPVSDVVNKAISEVKKNPDITPGNVNKIIENIKSEGTSLAEKHPDGLGLTEMHDGKITYSKNAGYSPVNDPSVNNTAIANRSLSTALQKTVEAKAPADIPVGDFNSYLSKYYKSADYLDSLNGKLAPVSIGQKIARGVAKFGGAAIGSHFGGGVVSEFAGYQIGKALEHAMENLSNPARDAFLKNLKITNPEAYSKVASFIGDQNAANATRLQLPPGAELGTAGNPIITPEFKGGESSVKVVPAKRGFPAQDPKTGKMIGTFTSGTK